MRVYHPEYLRCVRALCDEYGVLLILDEIATGFGRTGRLFAQNMPASRPTSCIGSAYRRHDDAFVAAASREVANAVSRSEAGVFMHGPTFMGNPLACAVAAANMQILARNEWPAQVGAIEAHFQAALAPLRHEKRGRCAHYRCHRRGGNPPPGEHGRHAGFFVEKGVWIRPFGKLITRCRLLSFRRTNCKSSPMPAAAVRYEAGFS